MINSAPTGWVREMGLQFVEATPERVVATIDITERHHQGYGIVHGGVYSGVIETLASVGAHLFADLASLTLAYAAMTVAERAPTGRHTFGLYRAEILAAFVNAQILLVRWFGQRRWSRAMSHTSSGPAPVSIS